jgi:FKBP-type peptidyl-prolyl cis-trans isomerase
VCLCARAAAAPPSAPALHVLHGTLPLRFNSLPFTPVLPRTDKNCRLCEEKYAILFNRMRQFVKRSAAGIGALVFLVTSLSLTILVIWSLAQGNNNQPGNDELQKALEESRRSSQECGNTFPDASTAPLPEAYKPGGKISSLQITDLKVGSGPESKPGDCLNVKYYGTLALDGKMFDTNYDKNKAFQFELGASKVIPGWDQGLAGMRVGGTRRLVVPANLAYGETGFGEDIPPNSDLVFEIQLIKIGI